MTFGTIRWTRWNKTTEFDALARSLSRLFVKLFFFFTRDVKRGVLPLHDDQQALLAVMHVLVQAEDRNDVRPRRHPPVELHLSSGFWAVVQNLGGRDGETDRRMRNTPLCSDR